MLGLTHLSGHKFGQYELRRMLGAGGMGAVYLGWQTGLKREVAIKILPPQFATSPGMIERFTREAETAAKLEHPHIVPIYDYGVEQGISYVVMRLLSGGSLSERLAHRTERDDPLPTLREVADVLNKLAGALDFAHRRGVVHRDIKPNNVMFDEHGTPFLVDFGIARLINATTALTSSNMQLGTPTYMSPEQWQGFEATEKSDQYALGIMAYVLVTGVLPFEAPTPFALMGKHLFEAPTPTHERNLRLPAAIDPIIARAIAKQPENRYDTVSEFAAAFDGVIRESLAGSNQSNTRFFITPLPVAEVPPIAFTPLPEFKPAEGATPPTSANNVAPPVVSTRPNAATDLNPVARRPQQRTGWIGVAALILIAAIGGAVFLLNGDGDDNGNETDEALIETTSDQTGTNVAIVPPDRATLDATPTGTPSPTLDVVAAAQATNTVEAAINAERTRLFAEGQTMTATFATNTPTATATATNFIPPPTRIALPSARPPQGQGPGGPGPDPNRPGIGTPGHLPPDVPPPNIVYASARDGDLEIYQVGVLVDLPPFQFTTNSGVDDSPSVSPDRHFIAYESNQDGDFDIYIMEVPTGEIQQITDDPADDFGPAWSRDGSKIAFHSNRDGDFEIYVVDLAGQEIRQVTANGATDRSASWSPDSTRLVYFSDESGGRELYIVELATGEITRLTENEAYDGLPDWSPNGTLIVFASNRDDEQNTDIYTIDVETLEVTRLMNRPGVDDDPAWSQDGRHIIFESNFDNATDNFDLWVMSSDGTGLRPVVENAGDDVSADW